MNTLYYCIYPLSMLELTEEIDLMCDQLQWKLTQSGWLCFQLQAFMAYLKVTFLILKTDNSQPYNSDSCFCSSYSHTSVMFLVIPPVKCHRYLRFLQVIPSALIVKPSVLLVIPPSLIVMPPVLNSHASVLIVIPLIFLIIPSVFVAMPLLLQSYLSPGVGIYKRKKF